jgi:hypothetical protein
MRAYDGIVRPSLVLVVTLALGTPGCASAIASALGATGSSAAAASDVDRAMIQAALDGFSRTAGSETRSAPHYVPDDATFGGEPAFVCTIPGDDETQILAASSLEGALVVCRAMNAMPDDASCTCREAELGSSLAGPIAEQ